MEIVESRKDDLMKEYNQGLHHVREHDACGIGAVVHIDGRQDYQVIDQALTIVEKLEHRAGKDADGRRQHADLRCGNGRSGQLAAGKGRDRGFRRSVL